MKRTIVGKMGARHFMTSWTAGWIGIVIAVGFLSCFVIAQFLYYFCCAPERSPRPLLPSRWDRVLALSLYALAYALSLLRLPFAVLPYCLKLLGVLVLRKQYQVSHYHTLIEVLRILGDFANWCIGIVLIHQFQFQLQSAAPLLRYLLYSSVVAETLRLFAEKLQMIVSACWQLLPHRHIAAQFSGWLTAAVPHLNCDSVIQRRLRRYCHYYQLADPQRIEHILCTLRGYAASDPEASAKLAYLSTLRIVSQTEGLRGGRVRDVARGEVFIHLRWTADPQLLIGQALRRTPWWFDPRYLRRPFYYRSESNRLATLFVLGHARYCPMYALYQFGHEIKTARYDLFYRLLRWLNYDIEPKVQADGTFPFDQGITWLLQRLRLRRAQTEAAPAPLPLLWDDQAVLDDLRRRIARGEQVSMLELAIATRYSYPLKYVREVLLPKIHIEDLH